MFIEKNWAEKSGRQLKIEKTGKLADEENRHHNMPIKCVHGQYKHNKTNNQQKIQTSTNQQNKSDKHTAKKTTRMYRA